MSTSLAKPPRIGCGRFRALPPILLGKTASHFSAREALAILGADDADRLMPVKEDKPKRAGATPLKSGVGSILFYYSAPRAPLTGHGAGIAAFFPAGHEMSDKASDEKRAAAQDFLEQQPVW